MVPAKYVRNNKNHRVSKPSTRFSACDQLKIVCNTVYNETGYKQYFHVTDLRAKRYYVSRVFLFHRNTKAVISLRTSSFDVWFVIRCVASLEDDWGPVRSP